MIYQLKQQLRAVLLTVGGVTIIQPSKRSALAKPDWRWLLLLFSLANLFDAIFWGQMSAFTPLYLPALHIPTDQVMLWTGRIAALATFAGIPFVPLWDAMADRYGRKPLIVRAFVAHLLASLLIFFAPNVWVFLLGRAVMTFALGCTGLMLTTMAEQTPARRIGLTFAILDGAGSVGYILGPLLGGPVVDAWGFPTLVLINIAFFCLCILGLAFGYHDIFQPQPTQPLLGMMGNSLRLIGGSPHLRMLFLALFLLFAGWSLTINYIPLLIAFYYHGQDLHTVAGLVVGAGGFLALLFAPCLGALGDRYGHWRILLTVGSGLVCLWPLPLLATTLLTFGFLWALLNSITAGLVALGFTVLSGAVDAAYRGRIMSFAYLPLLGANLLGPVVEPFLTTYGLFALFPAAAITTAVGVAVTARAAQMQRAPAGD